MPLPGPLRAPWTLTALVAPALGLACASLLVGCAADDADAPAPPASRGEVTLAPPDGGFGADPSESTEAVDDGSDESERGYGDVEGPFLLELGAVDGGLAVEVQLARVLVHVDGDVVALPVNDDWIPVSEASGRWAPAWEGSLPVGRIAQLELTLAGEALVDGEAWEIPGAWRDLFLDVPFESGDDMPLVVLTGLIDSELIDEEVQPWLAQTVIRQVGDDGTPRPYGSDAGR